MTDWWANPVFWILLSTFLPFFLFIVFYAGRSPGWRKTPAGRSIFFLAGSIVLVLGRSLLNLTLPQYYPGRQAMGYLFLATVAAAGWYLFIQLVKLQREGRREGPKELPQRRRDDP